MVEKKDVEYISQLARIGINEEEEKFLSKQLSRIIEYIDKLKEVNTDNVQPLRSLSTDKQLLRKDQVQKSSTREDILKNAPESLDNFFKTPNVIK